MPAVISRSSIFWRTTMTQRALAARDAGRRRSSANKRARGYPGLGRVASPILPLCSRAVVGIGSLDRSDLRSGGGCLAGFGHFVNDRWLREQVIGNGVEIRSVQIFETILNGLAHGALDRALLGRAARFHEIDDVAL